MKTLIFVLAFLGGVSQSCYREVIIISDANPIQFWVNGVQTFNQKEVCGITPVCYCHVLHCDDNIRIQFHDDDLRTYDYTLVVLINGATIATYDFIQIATGYYDVEFSLSDIPSACNEKIQFEIQSTATTPHYNVSMVPSGSAKGTWSSTPSLISFTYAGSVPYTSKRMYIPFSAKAGSYTINCILNSLTNIGDGFATAYFLDSAFNVLATSSPANLSSADFPTGILTSASDISYFALDFTNPSSGGSPHSLSFHFSITGDTSTEATTDCLDVKDSDPNCTLLIQYSNSTNFAGLDYEDSLSPDRVFYLRILATFFHETFPIATEDLDLSTSQIIQLWGEVRAKRRMDLGYMPYYMYRKLLLILAHDSVYIDSKYWIIAQGDGLTTIDGNKHYPNKIGSIILTERDFLERNVL